MNFFILIFSLVALSECNRYEGNFHPITTTTKMSKKYDWSILNDLVMDLLKQTTPKPTSSTQFEELPLSFESNAERSNENTSSEANSKISEELIAQVLKETDPEPVTLSPQLYSSQETSTPSYLSNLPPRTSSTSSPIPASRTTKPHATPTSIDAGLLFPSIPAYPEPRSFYHPPSNYFQQSQSAQQHELPPPFQYIPQEIPGSYNPPSFYNQQDWISPVISSQNELPYNPPSYIPDEIPLHFLHPIPYQSPLIPILPREQPLSHLPQVHNSPLLSYGQIPFASLNENTGADPSQSLPFLNNPTPSYGTPGHIVSFVRTYIPQQQFHPVQFHFSQPPVVSLPPSGYGPLSPQLSQEGITYKSSIQNSYAPSLPGISSPSLNPPSFPFQNYSNQPNFASVNTNTGKVSAPYSSVPIKTRTPLSYYREAGTSVTSDGSDHPVFIFAGSQPQPKQSPFHTV